METDYSESLPLLGNLPKHWEVVEFGSILDGGTRNGIYKKKEFHGKGDKIVNMGELFAFPRLLSVPMKRVELSTKEQEKFRLQEGDLLFARRSLVAEGAGKCSLVCEVKEPTTFESSIIRARPNSDRASSLYLFYLFQSLYGTYILDTIRRQVAVSGITGTDLVKLPIPLPTLDEQKKIAHILGTLDDKIELNQQMNQTLEGIARALFKSWFIDFDPVRAKLDGRQPAGMDAETAALFPDSFEDSPLGKIPKGWEVKSIGDVVKVIGGATPSTKESKFWDGGTIHWSTPKDLASLNSPVLLRTERQITEAGLQKIGSGLLPKGTVLLSSRAPIGYLAITEVPVAINQGYIAMVCDGEISNHYTLCWAETNMDAILGRANGTTFLEISKKNFRPLPVLIPPPEVMIRFNKQVAVIHQKLVNNLRESEHLSSIRDALLPKLLSGEIRVKDAEQALEAVVQDPEPQSDEPC